MKIIDLFNISLFYCRFTHLNHSPFKYNIEVQNKSEVMRKGICRIFLAPKYDENGRPMSFKEQRLLMTEMEKFLVECMLYDFLYTYC